MRKILPKISLIAALIGMTSASAQTIVVWSTTNFNNDPVGPYGTHTDFGCGSSPALAIVDPGIGGPGTHAMELSFNPVTNTCLNFQTAGISYPAVGNIRTNLSDYTIEFDMQVNGLNAGPFPQGFQISIFGPGGGVFGGPKLELDLKTNVFAAGAGYIHYSFPLSSFAARGFDPTAASFTVGIGIVSYAANFTATPETFDFANLQISMSTAPPPPPGTVVVWSTTNFLYDPLGTYGAFVDYAGGENVALNIVAPGELTGDQAAGDQAMEVTFDTNPANIINFQTCSMPYPANGNTNTYLGAYTLEFDMKVSGTNNVSPAGGLQLSLFADKLGPSGFYVFGANLLLPTTATNVFTAGTGYQHYSIPLSSFKNSGFDMTGTNFCVGVGYVSYPGNLPVPNETFDFAYFQIVMATNPPALPRPKMNVLAAKPGLRIFQKASDAVYTQEGIGTQANGNPTPNESWVGSATSGTPVSYAITFADFDTVAGYTMNVQFCPNAGPGDPYGVYDAAHDLLWRITSGGGASGFTTSVGFKTNAVHGGETNILLATTTTTSTNGRGTWTLTFTSDTRGTVSGPNGVIGSFDLAPDAAAYFANPLTILFGTSAGATGGFGQFIDISRLAITNVLDGTQYDDFTQDDVLNTSLWNPNFSRDNPTFAGNNDAGAVILVSSNTPSYWVNWNIPDDGFGLETKAGLSGGTNVWFSPGYYGSGTSATNTIPSLMGLSQKWTLIPGACLPTVDGTVGGRPSPTAFFRLSNPPASQ